ncbi:efflux RND transporter periplasmic adaptor subunit [Dyadobacter frigoris]|uniref:Efflux RND transporter periplasmic adaptor subunit n=1 Tax=Dyadobacter frigoris TaxID=2576211 RepID=A0A4U6CZP3_9BACT|nr:efflux RND transporter periplasmic adaptor subunit [Dyadobacter frigoris]TKT90360.1 efflux RND transporter periplasmic adaptor subunit [Dyadobacter frigoris]GLU52604.1 RND transporter MFP subunit [Dyadobacter frigoris]
MKTRIMLYFAALSIGFMLNGCGSKASENAKDNEKEEEAVVYPAVAVSESDPKQELNIPGELMSYYETDVFPKVNSYIKKINFDIGDRVKTGQVLAELEAPELSAQLAEAYSKVRSSEAQLTASRSVYRRLLQAAATRGAVSPNDMDLARSKITADSLSLLGSSAVYASVQQMNSYLKIRAPFDGIIADRKLSPGAFVGPGDKSAMPIFRIKQQNILRLQLSVPERFMDAVQQNQPVSFSVVSLPGEIFKGKINRISHSVDRQTRSELIEIQIPNPSGRLASGMYAQVTLPVGRGHASLIVPSSSVATTMEKCFVVKVEDGKAKWINVRKGIEADGKTEIFGGVKKGDIVLKTANDELQQGQPVKVSQATF